MSTSLLTHNGNGNGNGGTDGALSFARLVATTAAPVAAATGTAHHAADPISRLRDKWGNRLPWFYAYSLPTIDGKRLEETPLAYALAEFVQKFPGRAHQLHWMYNHQLVTAYQRLMDLRADEERKLLQACEKIERDTAEIDADLAQETQADRDALPGIESALQDAHREAGAHVARVGGGYEPEDPSDDCVLRLFTPSDEAVAAQLQLPWAPADKTAKILPWLGWATTGIVGAMIGVSLGILSHALIASDLTARPGALAGFVVGGLGAAILGKYAVFLSAREASQRYWLGRPVLQWGSFTAVAVVVGLGVLIMDSTVERHGLMAGVRMQQTAQSMSGGAQAGQGSETLYFIAALILTWGYVFTHIWEGYLHGRFDACRNRITDERDRQAREWEEATRQNADIRAALDKLAQVRDLVRQEKKRLTCIADAEARANARRLPLPDDLPDDAKRRLQEARDAFEGAQSDFDGEWATLRDTCEPLGGWGWKLGRWLAGLGRPDRRRTRNPKRAV